jgi:hypothetical protein
VCVHSIDYDDGGSYRRFITVDYRRPDRQDENFTVFLSSCQDVNWSQSLEEEEEENHTACVCV